MKHYLLPFLLLYTFVACQKEPLVEPTDTSIVDTQTSTQLDERTVASNTILSQRGKFAPFGEGSTWQYRTISDNYYCHWAGQGLAYSDTSYSSTQTLDTVILNQKEYIEMSGRLVHIQNGVYYYRSNGQDVQYMVEYPAVGMTWPNHRVTSTTATFHTPSGLFTNVVCVQEGDYPVPVFHFYKAGVGYLGKQLSYIHSYETYVTTALMSYSIMP